VFDLLCLCDDVIWKSELTFCVLFTSPVSWGDLATRLYEDVDDDALCIVIDDNNRNE